MYNFSIHFQYPWLLFALIPVFGVALFFHFRRQKKYRRTRNRIISLVLHLTAMSLVVCVFSGINFQFDKPNLENEILLLVDMSDSNSEAEANKDDFIRNVLDESASDYSIGIVMFGYDQVLASPFGRNPEEVYNNYINAPVPDTSATDIAAALQYARTVITNPQSAKIVILSDGLETDGDAMTAVRSVAASGIRVDTVNYANLQHDEVEIVSVAVPDYNVVVGDPFKMTVTLNSSVRGTASLVLYDNDVEIAPQNIVLESGMQDIVYEYTFSVAGMHRMSFAVVNEADTLAQNNTYYTYINIEVFDRILLIEREANEGVNLAEILKKDTEYTVDTVNIADTENMPSTVDELRMYDDVVLVNIANADMPAGFDAILNSYVYDYGGGLFTVGGNKVDDNGETVANTYNPMDMKGTLYQQMLPVKAINYTPPLGVIFLLDISGSMSAIDPTSGKTYVEIAKEACRNCVRYSLSERDYVGVISLSDVPGEVCQMIPVPQYNRVIAAIDNIQDGGGTIYQNSFESAGSSLMSLTTVEKRHVVLISDGMPGDAYSAYSPVIERYAKLGVTFTIAVIGGQGMMDDMEAAAKLGNGRLITITDINRLTEQMRNDLECDEIKGVNFTTFQPQIKDHTSVVSGISQDEIPELDGFYGTQIKSGASIPLRGEYVPIYAQWKYGNGSVGSFMCDLQGEWSSKFLNNETGQKILKNIILALFPTKAIRPSEIDVDLSWSNYTTTMSVFTELNEGERIEATISGKNEFNEDEIKPIAMNAANGYTRTTFVVTQPGVHDIVVRKVDANGVTLAETNTYRVFSYSKEYEALSAGDGAAFLSELAVKGKGIAIADYWEVFDGFEEVIHSTIDPRIWICLAALCLFLIDIAIRKFKFKWIHEIIKDRRDQKTRFGGLGKSKTEKRS
ncbi:MAG TPA: hypothetical protein DD415_02145 [Clostridiales bacterium]|nr:hypothetical protein [Clostridiales bacterium]